MMWRKFLTESRANIWNSIKELIEIAAEDHPEELRIRRDAFAEQLFSLPRSVGNRCDDAKPSGAEDCKPPPVATRRPQGRQRIYRLEDEEGDEEAEPEPQVKDAEESEEEAPEHRNEPDDTGSDGEGKDSHDPIDYDAAEQLTLDLDNEQLLIDQITKIGRKLEDSTMGEHDIHSLLRRLEDMHITFEVLKQTGIGKPIVILKRHASKQVRDLSRELHKGWTEITKVWLKSAGSFAKSGADSLPMDDGEHGLPSPPLDEGDLLAARDMDFSQVLADMEDDDSGGSGQMNGQDVEYRQYGEPLDDRPHSRIKKRVERVERRLQVTSSSSPEPEVHVREKKDRVIYSNGTEYKESRDGEGRQKTARQPKPSRKDTTYVKDDVEYASASVKPKSSNAHNAYDRDAIRGAQPNGYHIKKEEHVAMRKVEQRSGTAPPPSRPRPDIGRPAMSQKPFSPEISVAERLEAAKRKLHERYEEAEAAKKSRTVQVMDLHELPKGGPNRAKHPNAAQKPKISKSGHSIRR